MPTAAMIREADGDLKSIVAGVLNVAVDIEAQREEALQQPSVLRSEFTREMEDLDVLKQKFNANVKVANEKQKEKMKKVKKKYDRSGVEYVENEDQIGREPMHK